MGRLWGDCGANLLRLLRGLWADAVDAESGNRAESWGEGWVL